MKTVQVEYAGLIKVTRGDTSKELYSHQNEAIKALNEKNQFPFEGLLVLPTGGGKTLTYRKLINAVKDDLKQRGHENGFKMLGLTATPLRTDESEKGLLKLVFPNDIIFSEHLRNLIAKGILAEPIFENLKTKTEIKKKLTAREIKNIEDFDRLPKDIAEKIAQSSTRNKQIVEHYINNRKKYKALLVFAIDVEHAITLNALFKIEKVNSDFVVAAVIFKSIILNLCLKVV
ncbi:hypothetical protein A6S26_00455 [Nostoc sp. ATCC 43529]|nr:hypothetical protein A6S26_00455 [Nostoc sp. ATCC 43529]